MSRYIALIHRGETGGWGISFPDFPGCISAADGFEEVLDAGAQALRFHVEGMIEDGHTIPAARSLESLQADPEFSDDFKDAIVSLVPLLPPRAKPMRVNISLDSNLLLEIDAKAEQFGMNRSEFLAEAARRQIVGSGSQASPVAALEKGRADLDAMRRYLQESNPLTAIMKAQATFEETLKRVTESSMLPPAFEKQHNAVEALQRQFRESNPLMVLGKQRAKWEEHFRPWSKVEEVIDSYKSSVERLLGNLEHPQIGVTGTQKPKLAKRDR